MDVYGKAVQRGLSPDGKIMRIDFMRAAGAYTMSPLGVGKTQAVAGIGIRLMPEMVNRSLFKMAMMEEEARVKRDAQLQIGIPALGSSFMHQQHP